ncbi:MAG TPA: hypothetical protein VGG32_10610 [Thermoplasmata archaeon]|jgi:hypothetical protein
MVERESRYGFLRHYAQGWVLDSVYDTETEARKVAEKETESPPDAEGVLLVKLLGSVSKGRYRSYDPFPEGNFTMTPVRRE